MTPRRLALRLIRVDRGLLAGIALLMLLAVGLAVAAPRALSAGSDDALRSQVAGAADAGRTVTVQWLPPNRFYTGETVSSGQLSALGGTLLGQMAPGLRSVVDPPTWAAQAEDQEIRDAATGARPDPQSRQRLALRAQDGYLPHVTWVGGQAPAAGTPDLLVDGKPVARFQVAVDQDVAAALSIGVGDRLLMASVPPDRSAVAEVAGVFHPDDSVLWGGDLRMVVPDIQQTATSLTKTGVALIDPADVQRLDKLSTRPLAVAWRLPIIADHLDTDSVDEVLTDLGTYRIGVLGAAGDGRAFVVSSALDAVVARFHDQQASVQLVTALCLVAALTLVLVAVALAAWLLRRRREATFTLLRSRGASPGAVARTVGYQIGAVTVPAAVVGAVAAVLLVPSRLLAPALALGLLVTLATVVVPVVSAYTSQRTRTEGGGRTPQWRTALEILLIVVAVAGAWLVATSAGGRPALAAVVPTLLALAAGVVVVRLLGAALRLARRPSARSVGAVGVVTTSYGPRTRLGATVVTVVAAVAVSGLAGCLLASTHAAQAGSVYGVVGADARVDSTDLGTGAALDAVPGVCGLAPATLVTDAVSTTGAAGQRPSALLLLDVAAYSAIVAGLPLKTSPLEPLAAAPAGAEPVPVLAPEGAAAITALSIGGQQVPVRVVGVTPTSLAGNGRAPYVASGAAWPLPAEPNRWYVCGDVSAQALQQAAPGAVVVSAAAELAATRATPLVATATTTLVVTAALALLLALCSFVLGEVAHRPERAEQQSLLRTLGASLRQTRAVSALGVAPIVAGAVLTGAATGVGIATVVLAGYDLGPLSGGASPTLVVPWWILGAAVGAFVVVTALVVVAETTADSRRDLATDLRGTGRR